MGEKTRLLDRPWFNKVLLAMAGVIWGYSFFLSKEITESIPVFWLLGLRFSIAFVLTAAIFWRSFFTHLDKRTVGYGILIGVFLWAAYAFQTFGVQFTTPGKNAFLTAIYCVMVPFIAWMLGMGRPRKSDIAASLLCCGGLAFVALDSSSPFNIGDFLTIVCAVFYALQIVGVSKAGREMNVWALTGWQFLTMAVLSWLGAPFEGSPAATAWTPTVIWELLFFGVVCSFLCLGIMNYGLTKVNPDEGALLTSLESPWGVFFSVVAGYEVLSGRILIGFGLIFLGVVVSNGWDYIKERFGSRGLERPGSPNADPD